MDFDIIAIGGGFAGLISAVRSAQLGHKALVLERSSEALYINNSRVATGAYVVMGMPLKTPSDLLYSTIMETTDGSAFPELAKLIASNAHRAKAWLEEVGAEFADVKGLAGDSILTPPRRLCPGLDWDGKGSDLLMRTLETQLLELGGSILRAIEARSLVMEDGKCVGVETLRNGETRVFRSKSVVIADGGFQANKKLLKRYVCPQPEKVFLRSTSTATGDGILMAEAAGAQIGGFGKFYGHLQHRDAFHNERLWPYPQLDALAEIGIVVDGSGKRFADEGLGGVCIANEIAHLQDPLSASIIIDDVVWNGAGGTAHPVPVNPSLLAENAMIHVAQTIEELASDIGLPASSLGQAISSHNDAVARNNFETLEPRRTVGTFQPLSSAAFYKHPSIPASIAKAPFYAIPICAGLTLTIGGIRINDSAQALRPGGDPIQGLYVAGTPVWGLEGGPRAGYVGGLCKAFVLGLTAAEHASSVS
jgi:fumarate reductase flavoprotein subunit